jgi:hypothetical protein
VWEPPSSFCDLFAAIGGSQVFGEFASQFPVLGWLTGVQIGALALVCRPGMAGRCRPSRAATAYAPPSAPCAGRAPLTSPAVA